DVELGFDDLDGRGVGERAASVGERGGVDELDAVDILHDVGHACGDLDNDDVVEIDQVVGRVDQDTEVEGDAIVEAVAVAIRDETGITDVEQAAPNVGADADHPAADRFELTGSDGQIIDEQGRRGAFWDEE